MRKIKFNSNYYRVVRPLVMMSIVGMSFFGHGAIGAAEDVKQDNPSDNVTTVDTGNGDNVYGGGDENSESDSANNTVTINNGTFNEIFGGVSSLGNVYNNNVTIRRATINGGVISGFALTGSTFNNSIIIESGTISGEIIAGLSNYSTSTSDVRNNSIIVTGKPGLKDAILIGGMSRPGRSTSSNVLENYVEVNGGVMEGIIGGLTSYFDEGGTSAGNVTNNRVVINGGTITNVSGGEVGFFYDINKGASRDISQLSGGDVLNNAVDVNGGTIVNGIIGGSSFIGNAQGNTINISGGTISGEVAAGISRYPRSNVTVENNTVNISGSPTMTNAEVIGGLIRSSDNTSAAVKSNNVNISGGNIKGVIGGLSSYVQGGSNVAANVEGNHVVISGGEIGNVSGGEVGYSYDINSSMDTSTFSDFTGGNAINNTVNITGGTITNGVIGGSSLIGRATGNVININGGTISGDVIGGWSRYSSDESNARDNTITINGTPDLSDANLIGGVFGNDNDRTYVKTGNTLNINTKDITVGSINGFDIFNVNLQQNVSAGDTILTLKNSSDADISNTLIRLNPTASINLNNNDTITLLKGQGRINTISTLASLAAIDEDDTGNIKYLNNLAYRGDVDDGIAMNYDLNLSLSNNDRELVATFGDGTKNDQVDAISSPNTTPVHIAQNHIPELPKNSGAEDFMPVYLPSGYEIFFNTGGGHFKVKTGHGSSITSNVMNYDLGIARNFKTRSGMFVFAPLFEYSRASFDSVFPGVTNRNGSESRIKGDGSSHYVAGGVIARMINDSGFYYEGSFRGGRSRTDFGSSDFIINGARTHVNYDTDSPIFMGHVRFGNQKRLGNNNLLDVYGIFSYARQQGTGTTLSSGEHFDFNDVDSSRFRAGYRLTTRTSSISRIYSGLAYQFDTSTDSIAVSDKVSTRRSGISGSSGMLELGWQIRAFPHNPWMVDINTSGWVGLQSGFTAMAKLKKDF